ncbi:hypothetical protein GYY_02490 [Methanococcus maripaludis X1]|uniref:Uncharacterized protein n=1 Tax=Methanococcus maripaludis X1 TaxID=1053692 RepID=G0H3J1_METMI|nr:hypothetical protein GYY_02490 [Methanococcus maripaludis X1]
MIKNRINPFAPRISKPNGVSGTSADTSPSKNAYIVHNINPVPPVMYKLLVWTNKTIITPAKNKGRAVGNSKITSLAVSNKFG